MHRDLKPENILLHTKLDGSLMIKVTDFGTKTNYKSLVARLAWLPVKESAPSSSLEECAMN